MDEHVPVVDMGRIGFTTELVVPDDFDAMMADEIREMFGA